LHFADPVSGGNQQTLVDALAVGLAEELVYIVLGDVMIWGITLSLYSPSFTILMLKNKVNTAIDTQRSGIPPTARPDQPELTIRDHF